MEHLYFPHDVAPSMSKLDFHISIARAMYSVSNDRSSLVAMTAVEMNHLSAEAQYLSPCATLRYPRTKEPGEGSFIWRDAKTPYYEDPGALSPRIEHL